MTDETPTTQPTASAKEQRKALKQRIKDLKKERQVLSASNEELKVKLAPMKTREERKPLVAQIHENVDKRKVLSDEIKKAAAGIKALRG